MKRENKMSFFDKEAVCLQNFENSVEDRGPFWHVCTPGKLSEIIFTEPEDYRFAVSNMAISAAETEVRVITDQIMSNHIHGLLQGSLVRCRSFMEVYSYRLGKYLARRGRYVNLKEFRCDSPIPVTDYKMARNEIVYINRNGYVADYRYTPFSYPWGSGSLYFNPYAKAVEGVPYADIPFLEKRSLTFRRVFDMPAGYKVRNGMILPSSYCDYRLGESLFSSAHQYFSMLSKNFESYSEESRRIGDSTPLVDDEVYSVVRMLSVRDYDIRQPSLLPPDAKLEIARKLHFDYRADNEQIRRILRLSPSDLDALFPRAK